MPEFCSCGSIIINGNCTNKTCPNHNKQSAAKTVKPEKISSNITNKSISTISSAKPDKKKDPRRASKCITYNLYDLEKTNDQ